MISGMRNLRRAALTQTKYYLYARVRITAALYSTAAIGNLWIFTEDFADGEVHDGEPFASSQNTQYQAAAAFSYDNPSTFHRYWRASGSLPQWLAYQFSTPQVIMGYGIQATNPLTPASSWYAPTDFTFEVSNDAVMWEILDTQVITDWVKGEVKNFLL